MFEETQDKKTIWRSRFNLAPIVGKKYIVYYEDLLISALAYGLLAFVVITFLLWQINIKGFVRPPNPNFIGSMPDFINSNAFTHLATWFKFLLHALPGKPFHEDIVQYRKMGAWLVENGLMYTLIVRVFIAFSGAVLVAIWGAVNTAKHPIASEVVVHKRGMKVLIGWEAQKEWARHTFGEIKKYGSFCEFAKGMFYSVYRVTTHTIGIGASGSGKSQFLEVHVKAAMNMGVKCVILDPKYEFTQALYNPNDPSHAILDPTDARSHVWDIPKDVNTISKMRRFANAFIPAGEGEGAMWGNAARQLFVGAQVYLSKQFPDYTPKDITDIFSMLSSNEYYYIMKNFYPPGLDSVGTLNEEGNVDENVTNFGVRLNLKGYIDGLVDLGRYWYNPKQKRISLFEFMTNPDYPIKTIFIKPNDNERLMSSGVIRSMLNFMIALLDTPDVVNSKRLKGVFFLDEFQAPGKLVDETGSPTINKLLDRGRSKGWGSYLFVQDILQLWNTYSENEVEQWRVVASQFVLTGTPPGKTAQMVSDMIGKEYFDKVHTSYGFDPQTGKRKMGDVNIQEHEAVVILPSEIAGYLKPTDDGMIRFLLLARGLNDAFIFEKPIVPLDEVEVAWIEQAEDTNIVNPDSRVVNLVRKQMEELAAKKKAQEDEEYKKKMNGQSTEVEIPDDDEEGEETVPHGDDILDDPLPLNDDDDEEIVLYSPKVLPAKDDSSLTDDTQIGLKLAREIAEELRLTEDLTTYLELIMLGKISRNLPALTIPILKIFSSSPRHKAVIEQIRKLS